MQKQQYTTSLIHGRARYHSYTPSLSSNKHQHRSSLNFSHLLSDYNEYVSEFNAIYSVSLGSPETETVTINTVNSRRLDWTVGNL